MTLPGAYGDSTLQLRMVVAVAWAVLAAGSLHSTMGGWEAAAGSRLRQVERTHLVAAGSLAAVLAGSVELAVAGTGSAVVLVRAVLTWWGLAVLSGRVLGRPQSWVLPALTLFPLSYLGWDTGGALRWWNWPWASPGSVPCWTLTTGCLALGALAWLLTPRRWRALAARGRR
ncbi:hypothetical protein [Kitasatospora cineracea]|uniref:hypothetical protein n=1 Tax=Kitasatospora cineracea TaxID=88074 RepID=UPI003829E39F